MSPVRRSRRTSIWTTASTLQKRRPTFATSSSSSISPVNFNGELLSGASHRSALPSERSAWSEPREGVSFAGIITGDLELLGMASGELRCVIENVRSSTGVGNPGSLVLIQGRSSIRTMRSGFGLAGVAMQSRYQWGGIVDLPFLRPTAGREALDAESNQLLQQLIGTIDKTISPIAAAHAESFANDGFLQWVVATKQFSLCGPLEVTPRPGETAERLESVVERSGVRYYGGRDPSVISTYASEDEPLIILSRRSPRRDCEIGYLRTAGVDEVDISPRRDRGVADHRTELCTHGARDPCRADPGGGLLPGSGGPFRIFVR